MKSIAQALARLRFLSVTALMVRQKIVSAMWRDFVFPCLFEASRQEAIKQTSLFRTGGYGTDITRLVNSLLPPTSPLFPPYPFFDVDSETGQSSPRPSEGLKYVESRDGRWEHSNRWWGRARPAEKSARRRRSASGSRCTSRFSKAKAGSPTRIPKPNVRAVRAIGKKSPFAKSPFD